MSLPIHVDEYSGRTANQRPRSFSLDERLYEIAAVLDQWYEPSATYFKVQTEEGKVYLLRYDGQSDEWTLESEFDGDEYFPTYETGTFGMSIPAVRQLMWSFQLVGVYCYTRVPKWRKNHE